MQYSSQSVTNRKSRKENGNGLQPVQSSLKPNLKSNVSTIDQSIVYAYRWYMRMELALQDHILQQMNKVKSKQLGYLSQESYELALMQSVMVVHGGSDLWHTFKLWYVNVFPKNMHNFLCGNFKQRKLG